ncbi:15266_t:CDS:2 [Gigaspora rosea]|nr:15266_t:CDS:2 [Gigaspora rosea]
MKTDTVIPCLVTDVIIKIFENVSIRDLFSILLVNREWCRLAIPLYWKAPFSYTKTRSRLAIKIYRLFLKKKSQNIKKQNLPTLFDYPLFLKELNYTNLLELDRTRVNVRAILKLLIDRGVNLNIFVMGDTAALGEYIYGLWTDSCYTPMFSSLVYIKIYSPFPKNRVIKTLVDNCTKLSHLDINLYDNNPGRIKMMLNYLEELFNAQRCLLNLRLTTHWHFGNDGKISNFYFHSEKSSTEPYFDEPIVIKPTNYTGRMTRSLSEFLNRANSQTTNINGL